VRRALIVVHWLTDFGGLHENVLDTVGGLMAGGWRVILMAPASKTGPRFLAAGADVLDDSLDDVAASAARALSRGGFDLVHAHPFQARRVGAAVAAALGTPLVVTMHGQYDDEFAQYRRSVHRIVCVSDAVAEHVEREAPYLAHRLVVIPNGVDFEVFKPRVAPRRGAAKTIAIASRLDPDKGVLSRAVAELVDHLVNHPGVAGAADRFELRVAGERFYGPTANPLTAAIDRAAASGSIDVVRMGWISDRHALRGFFAGADVVVAPGRAAMEAIACGVPTIAAASRGYIGLVTGATLPLACATNFGGVQQDATAYSTGAIVRHLGQALAMPALERRELRERLRILHDVRAIQGAHLALYENLCNSGRAA
jgi:glycosyltransferase involved in cell wall biosynthesis